VGVDETLKQIGLTAESVSRVKLGNGVVGKATWAFIALAAVLAVAAYRVPDPTYVVYAAVGAFFVFFVGVMIFALRNPGAALLEGGDLLLWQTMTQAAKELPNPPAGHVVVDPRGPALPAPDAVREEPQ
jgi:hypothetical protein